MSAPSIPAIPVLTPPCCKKPSIPAFSVSTWKLMACNPFTTINLRNFANSQPATRTMIAKISFGKKYPNCVRNARTGSNARLTCSITPSFFLSTLEKDLGYTRTTGSRVTITVEDFLSYCWAFHYKLHDAAQGDADPL